MARNIKILRWSVGFGIISLAVLIIFILALKMLFMDFFSEHVLTILIVSGIFLVIFIVSGTLSIRAIFKKFKL